MGLLDAISNIKFEPNPVGMGLLGLGAQMMQSSNNQRTPIGFGNMLGSGLEGFNNGLQQYQQNQMQDAQLKHYQQATEIAKRQDDQKQAAIDAMRTIDLNDPNAVTKLLQAGLPEDAMKLYKAQNPGKGAEPYFTPISTPKGVASFNARTGQMDLVKDENGNFFMKAPDDPDNQGKIQAAKSTNTINKYTLEDGREVPMWNGAAVGNLSQPTPQGDLNGLERIVEQGIQQGHISQDQGLMILNAAANKQNKSSQIGQSTYDKTTATKTAENQADAASNLNSRLLMLDDIIEEAQKGINALGPKTDKLTNKVVGFDMETGGMFPEARKYWNDKVLNDQKLHDIEKAAAGSKLQNAITFLKGQGSVTEGERNLIGEQVGIDPYTRDSQRNYEQLMRVIENAKIAKQAISNQSQGNFSEVPRVRRWNPEKGALE